MEKNTIYEISMGGDGIQHKFGNEKKTDDAYLYENRGLLEMECMTCLKDSSQKTPTWCPCRHMDGESFV